MITCRLCDNPEPHGHYSGDVLVYNAWTTPRALHRRSMALAEQALRVSSEACDLEVQALDQLDQHGRPQPTYSVLCRSAGWLAYHAGSRGRAATLAVRGLSARGCPADIRAELYDLLHEAKRGLDQPFEWMADPWQAEVSL